MIFDRKKTPESSPTLKTQLPEPLPDHNIELRAEWDDENAEWEYGLYRVIHPKQNYGVASLGDVPQPKAGEWIWTNTNTGDKAWADRQAEHYKVEIIYEEVKP